MKELVEICEYDPEWVENYFIEREQVMRVLKDIFVEMEHIGSTSVPGLGAKSLIDMMAGVSDLQDVKQKHIDLLSALGYEYVPKPEFPERLFSKRGVASWHPSSAYLQISGEGLEESAGLSQCTHK